MITDARVLEDDHLPEEVPHREAEKDLVTDALEPILRGAPAHTTLLTGPSGAGKTCVARFGLRRLREQILGLNHHLIDCWENGTRFKVLESIVRGVDALQEPAAHVPSGDTLLQQLRDYDGPQIVLILDEADQLEDHQVLYDLAQIHEVSMIMIANREEDFLASLDGRARSYLHITKRERFDQYGLSELVSILEDRVEAALQPGVIDTDKLEFIADAAAGNARNAITTLRIAAKRARANEADRLTHDRLKDAASKADDDIREKNAAQLTDDQRALYEVLRDDGGDLGAGDLYQRYRERLRDPLGRRMVRKHLKKLRAYGLVVAEGQGRWRTYRAAT